MEFTVIDKTIGKEAEDYKIALTEDWAKGLCYCDMEGFAVTEGGGELDVFGESRPRYVL